MKMELKITCAETQRRLKLLKEREEIKTNTSALKYLVKQFFEQEKIIQDLNHDLKVKKYQLKIRRFQ